MRQEAWSAATVLALCLVAALLGAGLAKERQERPGEPNLWVMPE